MFSSIFQSFANLCNKQNKGKNNGNEQKTVKTPQQSVDNVFMLLNNNKEESVGNIVTANFELSSGTTLEKPLIDSDLINNFDAIKSENSSIVANKQIPVEDSKQFRLIDQIESLQCFFTWKLESHRKQDVVTLLINKYGGSSLDVSETKFTFVRFIGNLIISYELYLNGESDASDMKILEVGNWLEALDKGTDDFYLSINIGLKHIRMANFIHKLLAANETGGFKRLFDEIIRFDHMDNKSKAAVHAIHAAILVEYGENLDHFKNACKYAKEACQLDPETFQWFHIYAMVLTAQRQFLHTYELNAKERLFWLSNELCPTENEINLAVQRAVISSDGKSTCSVNSLVLYNLKQFLANEKQMALTRLPVLKTVNSKNISKKNLASNLEEELENIVKKHKNGEDALPYLTILASKYNECDRWKIMAQICSYTILFTNNLRVGVEQFSVLLDEPAISTSDLIMLHNSSFINGSKKFNLAELICNEIRLATIHLNGTSIEDILFYYEMYFKIEEIYCNLKIKVIDPFMKVTLINDSSARSTYSVTTYQNEADASVIESTSSDNGSVVDINKNIMLKHKTGRRKQQSTIPFENGLLNPGPSVNLSHLQKQIEQYDMHASILTNSQLQYNLYNFYFLDLNGNLYQNYTHFNSCFKQYQCSESIPSLLDLKLNRKFQSSINNIITANVTPGLTYIDISLSKLPRFLTSQVTYKACLQKILQNYPSSFRIYTDASKIQNNVGIAIVSDKARFSYKLTSQYTSCDAEAVAILRALDYALTENYNDYIILSDSLNTIMCIQNLNTSSDVICSILCLIQAHQLKGNVMHFIWVPGHNAIEGNEKADKLAKQIATSATAITYSHNSFMATNIKYNFS